MQSPVILVIDDSPTIRKMVECHLSQAGYRVVLAADAQSGIDLAATSGPDLILLDHQLPGTTGEEVCRALLQCPATARVPVLISSAMRNRAFALYAGFTNVIDQIPKPFTPELLKSGVSNALQTGAMVVQSQQTGCAMPDALGETVDSALEGDSAVIPLRALLDFLSNLQVCGRVTLEQGKDRLRFALSAGRVQAVYSPTVTADRLADRLPPELADLGPLLSVTLGEHQDASMSGLVRLLEKSLADPRRLRGLLRFQAAVLTFWALTGEAGRFSFEAGAVLPPMFQAFPLQLSVPALAIEGVRRCTATSELERLGSLHFARRTSRGGNVDRSGLTAAEVRVHTLLDGSEPLTAVGARAGLSATEVAAVALGLELAGQAERRSPVSGASILLMEDDPEVARVAVRVLGADGEGYQVRHVRDRVAAQLLLRRNPFGLVILPIDTADQEAFYHTVREHVPPSTRIVGIVRIEEESQLDRLDALGLDGVLHRPPTEPDLRDTVRQLLGAALAEVP
jgi:DNA-binding response OmpR family regulator